MTVSALTIVVVGAVLAVAVLLALWAYGTANRLDRLHVRTDLAWQALDSALARRAVAVRGLAQGLDGEDRAEGLRLVELALRAERVDRAEREQAENALSRVLASVDPSRVARSHALELADADARVLIARRFHNDAVRDTRALQGRRAVRWLRLAGTAPMPQYFDITEQTLRSPEAGLGVRPAARPVGDGEEQEEAAAEPAGPTTQPGGPAGAASAAFAGTSRVGQDRVSAEGSGAGGATGGGDQAAERVSARVVILDDDGSVLLARGTDPAGGAEQFWFTFGGGVEEGESLRAAAVRELREETGLEVDGGQLCGPVWRRLSLFPWNGRILHSQEHFFVLRTARFTPQPAGRTPLENDALLGHRWFSAEELAAEAADGVAVYPHDLPSILPDAEACWSGHGAGDVRTIR